MAATSPVAVGAVFWASEPSYYGQPEASEGRLKRSQARSQGLRENSSLEVKGSQQNAVWFKKKLNMKTKCSLVGFGIQISDSRKGPV